MVTIVYDKGYRVSECGKIVTNPKGRSIKLQTEFKKGKPYVNFSHRKPNGGNATRVYVHKLKAYQMFGEEFYNESLVVCHINDVSDDNSTGNLKLGTQQENMLDRIKNANKGDDFDLPF
jgi:hypothetical protein